MSNNFKIKKGFDIKLKGEAKKQIADLPLPKTFAVKPVNFKAVIPKLLVKEGDEVKAGTALFYDKENENVIFSSPVSGEVIEIVRGEKRKLLEIKILADQEISHLDFKKENPNDLKREDIIEALLKSGVWPFIRQRPYGTIANPVDIPKSIFISCFDTAPLAPDYNFILQGCEEDFQTGINALKKLTDGKIHLNIDAKANNSTGFKNIIGVEINNFSGPHPAGNVGVQIHHIDPINKGDIVFCLDPQSVLVIGRLFNKGIYDVSRIVAVTGSQINSPQYYKTMTGCNVRQMIEDAGILEGETRIISGNVLSGEHIDLNGFLNFYDSQITVIPEGHEPEFFGWLKPGFDKLSLSRSFFSWLMPQKIHELNTNLHGELRPFVMSGEYEKVFPMDIYPVQLLKSILIEDIDLMEHLGIYEVVEEDFALCEFMCTSKIDSQNIIRKGLELIRKEFN